MKKYFFKLATIVFVCLVGFIGCSKSETSNISNQPISNKQISEISNAKVDASLQNVASNFSRTAKERLSEQR